MRLLVVCNKQVPTCLQVRRRTVVTSGKSDGFMADFCGVQLISLGQLLRAHIHLGQERNSN